MRKLVLFLVAAASIFVLTVGATMPLFPDRTASDAAALGISVNVRPSSSSPIQPLSLGSRRGSREVSYLCSALVTNESGTVATVEPLTVFAGQQQSRSAMTNGINVKLTAAISADGTRAETTVSVTRAARLLTKQRASVWLQPTEPANPIQPLR
jgi:hypothetical protein